MRYIILSKTHGIFVGTVVGYALFSKSSVVGTYKAYTFDSDKNATEYINKNFKDKSYTDFFSGHVEIDTEYASCVDLIKNGYEEYVGYMLDFMPMISESIH